MNAAREATRIQSLLNSNQVLLYLWRIKPIKLYSLIILIPRFPEENDLFFSMPLLAFQMFVTSPLLSPKSEFYQNKQLQQRWKTLKCLLLI